MVTRLFRLAACLGTVMFAAACASTGDVRFDDAEISADAQLASYDRVYIADVAIADELRNRTRRMPGPTVGAREREISERDFAAKAADLKRMLEREIATGKQIVTAPGHDVLNIEPTILDLAASRPTMADLQSQPGLSFESRYTGGADIEIAFSNGGRRLGVVRESWTGDLSDPTSGTSIWDDADRAFSITARKVARLLDQ